MARKNQVIHINSNVEGKLPTGGTASLIASGEIAVNHNANKPFLSILKNGKTGTVDSDFAKFSSDDVLEKKFDDRYATPSNITDLQGAINNKAEKSHTHSASDITGSTKLSMNVIPTGTTSSTVAIGSHTHSGVYQPVGNYASASTVTDLAGDVESLAEDIVTLGKTIEENELVVSNALNALNDSIDNKAEKEHIHDQYLTESDLTDIEGQVENLGNQISGKAPISHTHGTVSLTGGATGSASFTNTGASIAVTVDPSKHTHSQYLEEQDLTDHEGTKANASTLGHVNLVSGDLNGKSAEDGKAASQSHTHGQYSTTGHTHNQYSLTGHTHSQYLEEQDLTDHEGTKANASTLGHVNLVSGDLNGKSTEDGKAASQSHTHGQYSTTGHTHSGVYQPVGNYASASTVTDLEGVVNNKAEKSHTHSASDITGSTKLSMNVIPTGTTNTTVAIGNHTHSQYSTTGHTHSVSQINDFQTEVDSRIESKLAANDAMIFKGTISSASLPTNFGTGWTYKVAVAGTYYGVKFEIGDLIIAVKDGSNITTTSSNFTTYWTSVQTNTDGHVTGPASTANGNFASFDGTTGKLVKDSGYNAGSFKIKQDAVSDPSASGSGTTFIATISQDANGVITATKKNLQASSTSQVGVVQLSDSTSSTSTTLAATANAVKKAYDLANGKWTKSDATTSASGTVLLVSGDLNGKSVEDGKAASQSHTHSQYSTTGHSHSSYVNQNAFSVVSANGTTISADTTTDTLTIATGDTFVKITGDATNDKVTFGINTGTTSTTVARGDHSHSQYSTTGHSHSSYVNQNAFSVVSANGTTISADTTTDTLTVDTGDTFISITGDATNDKVTFGVNTGTTSTTVARGDHSHSQYSTTGHTHGASDITGTTKLSMDIIPTGTTSSTVSRGDHSHSASSITGTTKLSINVIPTGTTSSTVSRGDHSHSSYAASTHGHGSIWGQTLNGTTGISGNMSSVGNITPSDNATYDIGTSSAKFKNINLSNSANIGNSSIVYNATTGCLEIIA